MDEKYITEAVNEYSNYFEDNSLHRWGITFLVADSRLGEVEKDYLLIKATTMYLRDEKNRAILTDTIDGKLSTQGNYWSLGSFAGQRFDAQLDTEQGRVNVRFLVSEQTGMYKRSQTLH